MAHALCLAGRGLGNTWPNPAVGCVLVRDGRIVGRGWTQPGGRPHAERMALMQAGSQATGATAYVTLEPCAHQGHTPPCALALIEAGIARVVTALTDPDSRVSGRGHAMLQAAGVAVTTGIMPEDARRMAAGFLKRVVDGLPLVTVKLAMTLDGRIATRTGESRWITASPARRLVHAMRMQHDAVLVGSGTARADDPDLRVRDLGCRHQPVRIVLDSRLSHSPDSRLGRSAGESPVWLVHGPGAGASARQAWRERGARLIECPAGADGHIDPEAALRILAQQGLTRILCEGGATLAASLVHAGLADEMAVFHAGRLIGSDGIPAIGALGLDELAKAPVFRLRETRAIGPDTLSLWTTDRSSEGGTPRTA